MLWARLCRQFSWAINAGAFVLGMCGGFCLLVSVPIVMLLWESGVVGGDRPFDSATWKQNRTYPFVIPVRCRMSHDLVANHALVGKSSHEVEELLGPPDHGLGLEYFLREQLTDEIVLRIVLQDGTVSEVQEVSDSSD